MSKKTIITACGFLLFIITILSVNSISSTYEASVKKVLVVHSYHPQYELLSTISQEIKSVFEQSKNFQVETFYMNTNIQTSEELKKKSARWARDIIFEWKPDIVITIDDIAQEYVGKYYTGKEHPKIIFCDVKNKSEKYGYTSSHITSILEQPHKKEIHNLLSSFTPGNKNIAVINDNFTTSQDSIEYIKK